MSPTRFDTPQRNAPRLFTVSGDGRGAPAANILRIDERGSPVYGRVGADGIALVGRDRDLVLVLYGRDLIGHQAVDDIAASWANIPFDVLFAARQPGMPGVEQVSVRVPREAVASSGRLVGPLVLTIKAGGRTLVSNSVELRFFKHHAHEFGGVGGGKARP